MEGETGPDERCGILKRWHSRLHFPPSNIRSDDQHSADPAACQNRCIIRAMMTCPRCVAPIAAGANYCSACGAELSAPSETVAVEAVQKPIPTARHILDSQRGAAFAPGQVVAERYRIVGLLGVGGMGEVYRADDLKLATAVALKFLPRNIESDPATLERFHAEVRTARQVSHPHVCRVYDIGEVDGRHFLSMEYVDGEDLATLLHRIGRLPSDKAIEISRQLCAGLAAAHDKGVVHRDLKPANVMIDGHGRARITDFGLAVVGDSGADIAGTPAYMAPEQLGGQPATMQSDLYALGLVLYETFTGRRAFQAASLAEWRRVHRESEPTSPSLHTADMDPMVERVILRCLEKDPARRPRSALQVALAFPGGEPLAAAIAAGETPSPEMVAAAGGEGSLSPARAWIALGAFVVLLAGVVALSPHSTDLGLAPMRKSPDGLGDRAREIAESFGYAAPAMDEATWLERDYPAIVWLAAHLPSPEWRRRLKTMGAPVLLRYRRSPSLLIPNSSSAPVVTVADPPADAPGDIQVTVDAQGRLRDMRAMPPREQLPAQDVPPLPADAIFAEAGLEPSRFQPMAPTWTPPLPFDSRQEWIGSRAEAPEIPLRLSVARLGGRVISVAILAPWDLGPTADPTLSLTIRIAMGTVAVFIVVVLAFTVVTARRNLRLRRGDPRGAFRVALFCFGTTFFVQLSLLHPVEDWVRLFFQVLLGTLGMAAMIGGFTYLVYLALEPHLRRRMPHLLVGWARLMEGRWSDPLVGRDVLLGLGLGSLTAAAFHLTNALPTWVPFEKQTTIAFFNNPFWRPHYHPMGSLLRVPTDAILCALVQMTVLFVCRLFVRRVWVAACIVAIPFALMALGAENPALETPLALVQGAVAAIVISYLGLLGAVAMWFAIGVSLMLPVGIGLTSWYAFYSAAVLVLLLGLATGSFVVSLGGRSPFGAVKLDA
jgi:hypothetical protein